MGTHDEKLDSVRAALHSVKLDPSSVKTNRGFPKLNVGRWQHCAILFLGVEKREKQYSSYDSLKAVRQITIILHSNISDNLE